MSKRTCFMIFIVAVIAIMVSFILNFAPVTAQVAAIFAAMQNPWLAGSAAVAALLLLKQKHYWLIMLGLAVVAAAVIQLFIVGGALISVALVYKIAAFIVYAYLVALIRFMW